VYNDVTATQSAQDSEGRRYIDGIPTHDVNPLHTVNTSRCHEYELDELFGHDVSNDSIYQLVSPATDVRKPTTKTGVVKILEDMHLDEGGAKWFDAGIRFDTNSLMVRGASCFRCSAIL